MGFIIKGKGKFSAEARRDSFYLTYAGPNEEAITMEPLYEEMPDLLDTLTQLKNYLVSQGRLSERINVPPSWVSLRALKDEKH